MDPYPQLLGPWSLFQCEMKVHQLIPHNYTFPMLLVVHVKVQLDFHSMQNAEMQNIFFTHSTDTKSNKQFLISKYIDIIGYSDLAVYRARKLYKTLVDSFSRAKKYVRILVNKVFMKSSQVRNQNLNSSRIPHLSKSLFT